MSFFKKDKKRSDPKSTASPRPSKGTPQPRKATSGNIERKGSDPKSRPVSQTIDPGKTKPKKDDEDDFWGTDKSKGAGTPSPSSAPPIGGGMPPGSLASPASYAPPSQVAVPAGYIPTGFALDQFGQTVMVMVHAQSGQQFYQPVPPSVVQQYGFGTTGTKKKKGLLYY